jgi:hypothetical protein
LVDRHGRTGANHSCRSHYACGGEENAHATDARPGEGT